MSYKCTTFLDIFFFFFLSKICLSINIDIQSNSLHYKRFSVVTSAFMLVFGCTFLCTDLFAQKIDAVFQCSIASPSLETSIVEEKGSSDETLLKDNGSNILVKEFQETAAGYHSHQGRRISSANGGEASDSSSVPKESTSLKLGSVSSSLNEISIKNDESEETLQIFQAG